MKVKHFWVLVLLLVLVSAMGFVLSCGGGGGDKTSRKSTSDEDDAIMPDDDNNSGDDDAADDDAADDDATDDDAADDDDNGGLVWQDPPYEDNWRQDMAVDYCDTLELDGHDDWRLPTINEMRKLIAGCEVTMSGGECGVTNACLDTDCRNDACRGCDPYSGPGTGNYYMQPGYHIIAGTPEYWTSSVVSNDDTEGWYVNFDYGSIWSDPDTYWKKVRCVR